MNLKHFVLEYSRHRGYGLNEGEAFDAAMTSPRQKATELPSAVLLISADMSQPEVGAREKTLADPDVINKPVSPAEHRGFYGDGRGCFRLIEGGAA
jgi:hypothetical protein